MVKEMLAQSFCCVKFLKDILMLKAMSFDEELFSITRNCRVIFKRKPPLKLEDPGCFNIIVYIGDV